MSDRDAVDAGTPRSHDWQDMSARLTRQAQRLVQARHPLLWIEAADVSAMRAAVGLAEVCGATVHIAQSPGAENVSAVNAACGTFGTSLAEVAAHADLIVHVGHRHLVESPRLAARFLQGDAQAGSEVSRRHVLIGDQPIESWADVLDLPRARHPLWLRWPRHAWLDRLTRVLLAARGDTAPSNRAADADDAPATELAELLAASRYAVFIWDEDEFADELDRLLVERLFEIAQLISRATRCSLLPLGSSPGRTTGKETLLWLTNVASTARYADGGWGLPQLSAGASLDDWQREHDWILCVRNLPSDRALPDLRFQLMIDAACNRPGPAARSASDSQDAEIMVASCVGIDAPGHLIRIDHGLAVHLDAAVENSQRLPRADQVLRELTRGVLTARGH